MYKRFTVGQHPVQLYDTEGGEELSLSMVLAGWLLHPHPELSTDARSSTSAGKTAVSHHFLINLTLRRHKPVSKKQTNKPQENKGRETRSSHRSLGVTEAPA